MGKKVISYEPSATAREFHSSPKDIRGIRGPVGCLDGETEVMTPVGWKKIREWRGGEILLWSPDGVGYFGRPRKHIVAPCEEMLRFDCGKHMEMRLTPNHRVPLYGWDGRFVVKSAEEVSRHPSKHLIPATWEMASGSSEMSDDEIRLWVATCADGNCPKAGKQCVFAFRRARKIYRLKEILGRLGIEYRVHVTHRSDGSDETKVTISRAGFPKHFDWRVTGFSSHQLDVFVEELKYWDGLADSGYDRYDTTDKGDADIVQFACHAIGRNATISVREDRRNSRWSKNYSVHIAKKESPKNKVALRCDSFKSEWVKTSDGRQYCFETETGFFIARYNGHVFVTGNSGKSVACCFDMFLRSMEQEPCGDGVVRNRWLVLRNTLPELKDTTIKTWLHWFPMTEMNWTPPYHGVLRVPHLRNPKTLVEIELIFMGCDQPDFEEKLKSLEITGCWGNEACQIRWGVLNEAYKRCGRYPAKEKGRSFRSWGLVMDTNSPDDSNWWYKFECVKRYPEMAFFVQPPALVRREEAGRVWYEPNRGQDPADPRPAENIENLNEGFDYYLKQIVGTDEDVIRRLLLNQFGTVVAGRPIYPEWRDSVHFSTEELKPDFGLPIVLGQDFGRTPATVIGQMTVGGQIRILDEVVSDGMGITQFTQEVLRPLLVAKYGLLTGSRVICFADPAGGRADQVDEATCIQRMCQNGVYTVPCPGLPTNSFVARRECVSDLLRSRRDGKPALVLSSRCEFLRRGFNGGYCYRKMRGTNGGDDRYSEEADKNEYSHPHDALQYLCYGALHGGEDLRSPVGVGVNGSGSWYADDIPDLGGFGV